MGGPEALAAAVRNLAGRWGCPGGDAAVDKLVAYALELERWNRRINLIRFRSWDELASRHLVDGLAAARHLPEGAGSLVDVGSGAGIPGAIVASLRPEWEVVALEPIHKKHAFLRSVRRKLALANFKPYAARLGGGDEPEGMSGRFDAAISRATWPVPEWLEKGRRLVRSGGLVLAMEGRERAELPAGADRHEYAAGDRQRAIVVLRVGARGADGED